MEGRTPRLDTLVLGAGVIGLTTAVRLLERGHRVTVWAESRTPHTTSDAAAALFFPYGASADARTLGWVRDSFSAFSLLAGNDATGVRRTEVVERTVHDDGAGDAWRTLLPATVAAEGEGAGPSSTDMIRYGSFLIEMPRYLPWLEARVQALDGRIETRRVTSLLELLGVADVVLNCTGLGARDLVPDPSLFALRGQTVRVEDPGLSHALLDFADRKGPPTYAIPRSDGVILGGTADAHLEDLEVDMAAEKAMIARAARLDPRVGSAAILERRVALRPARDRVRLEADLLDGLRVIHHYGHGGAGVTLSWGSAQEAAALAEAHARPRPPAGRPTRTPARIYTNRAHRRPAR